MLRFFTFLKPGAEPARPGFRKSAGNVENEGMLQRTDFYPTRDDFVPDMFPRQEPVIHSSGLGRERGPLGQDELDRFERDGFLWMEGFFPESAVSPFLKELQEMAGRTDITDLEQVVMDSERREIRSVFAMHELSAAFDRMTRDPVCWIWCSRFLAQRSTSISQGSTARPVSAVTGLSGIQTLKPGIAKMACRPCAQSALQSC